MEAASDLTDEWEYEYDETETEDFYITIDLTSNTGGSRRNLYQGNAKENGTHEQVPNTGADVQSQAPGEEFSSIETSQKSTPQDRIQILELHSPNPIISYRNRFYSCHWASTLGTDLIFLKDPADAPLVADVADHGLPAPLLATSNFRLVATEAQIVPRTTTDASSTEAAQYPNAPTDESSLVSAPREGHHEDQSTPAAVQHTLKISLTAAATRVRREQAAFLEKLHAAKRKRGETDPVILNPDVQQYGMSRDNSGVQRPSIQARPKITPDYDDADEDDAEDGSENVAMDPEHEKQREIRSSFSEMDTREPSGSIESIASPGVGSSRVGRAAMGGGRVGNPFEATRRARGRARTSRAGRRKAAGGLFRDYRPVEGDLEGAEYRAAESQLEPVTPKSWSGTREGSSMGWEPTLPLTAGDQTAGFAGSVSGSGVSEQSVLQEEGARRYQDADVEMRDGG